jgi:hypothetical protein
VHATSKPAEFVAAPRESARDHYCGAPLGVEAAWRPNGLDVPPAVAVTETKLAIRPIEA